MKWLLTLPERCIESACRMLGRLWWFGIAVVFRLLWSVFQLPERWLADQLAHAEMRLLRFSPLPSNFNAQSGRIRKA